ncbi:tRNA glutamyl-Q(34) synthetase GluQRS [Agarivorans gilvus]|uniref:Glutamyl-Q tRNA(Asp) synthetase n=1 Tax=Agarivorans gilvus TaxID=680279 RepID=A0ABQ1I2P8_9ALTE|nr:tRNA glutamyl-Q(34) synthetase GluQRS [Agarivorans gilvus]GGB08468.1 glutamyl-Q tRNA(Asp) synthetase [Agarivorans gilvus]
MTTKPYIGRFAPSPSGPLHLGSLVAALGSYLQARSQQGQWLLRIEDIDPPREQAGASDLIQKQLEQFGLYWDGEVRYQSQQLKRYQEQIEYWLSQQQAYYCQCTRKQIKASGGVYLGHCRNKQLSGDGLALRFDNQQAIYHFHDQVYGEVQLPAAEAAEDFIIKRRDGLYAYNLAVSLDDADQGITEVVRGADLLYTTGKQIAIFQRLALPAPAYLHLPLVLDQHGNKLSKQNHAPSISGKQNQQLLLKALNYLGQANESQWIELSCEQIVDKAVANWQLATLPKISLNS